MAELDVLPLVDSLDKNDITEEIKKGIAEINTDSNERMNIDQTESVLQSNEISYSNVESESNEVVCDKQVDETEVHQYPDIYKFENQAEIANFNAPHMKHFAGCKWSPDGTCLLTNCVDYTLRIFDLPKDIHSKTNWNSSESMSELQPSLAMKEGGRIYDFVWYPLMSSWEPLTCW
ncbi:unnamed protein product [Nezara viridula]|uniref:Uncharacterized protein n=1 Tax=Nezara viridula TaxID=85310 RepID=A0A9P0HIU1_NEZVI|nr:unnamed protein product [Nezara viridula]